MGGGAGGKSVDARRDPIRYGVGGAERMKKFDEWWFPAQEEHLPEWLATVGDRQHGRLLYQGKKYRTALRHVDEPQHREVTSVGPVEGGRYEERRVGKECDYTGRS